jgi:NADH dehydrogenase [ubiquinone] 1 alpha subcomplex assembly factor 3
MSSQMSLRTLPRAVYQPLLRSFTTHTTRPRTQLNSVTRNALTRRLSTTPVRRDRSFTNLLADENPPPVQVSSISEDGILLADGLLLPSSCIFFDGHVFLWDVPQKLWEGWGPERFEFFEATLNRPGLRIPGE